jgi:serine protease AprX
VIKLFPHLLACTLAVIVFSLPAAGSSAPRIDPQVWQDIQNGQVTQFLVILKAQVNTRALLSGVPDRQARGQLVFSNLQQTAEATQGPARAALDALGAKYRAYWIVNLIAVEGDRRVLDAMAARPEVASIQSNRPFRVPLERPSRTAPSSSSVQWNISRVNAPGMWANGFTGQGRTYANADTGVQWDHPALKAQYRGWNGTSANHNYNWWDAIHENIGGTSVCGVNSPVPCDDYGHGTHTMGIGVGADGTGNRIGVAPGAKWMSCRNMQNGFGQPSAYLECFQFFLAPWDLTGKNPDPSKAPDVVGNSYGCPPSEGCTAVDVLRQGTDNLRQAGIFMAVSAGNTGSACGTVSEPPALYDSAITVGATDISNGVASSSSRGPVVIDGSNRLKPEVVAPGVAIVSSYPPNIYAEMYGTSMAAPHVAGAVALLWSALPQLRRNVDLTESILEASAAMTTDASCGGAPYLVPNNVYGYGRIDVLAACNYADKAVCPNFKNYRQYVPLLLHP